MEDIEFDITLHTGELYAFTLRHTYYSISGVFSLVISFGSLVACLLNIGKFAVTTVAVLLFIASLFTIVQPLMLYAKCKVQVKKSQSINATLHYVLSQDGIAIRQQEQEAKVKWHDIRKAVYTNQGAYLYMSPVRAFIFPKRQCGGQYHAICQFISEQMEKPENGVPEEAQED